MKVLDEHSHWKNLSEMINSPEYQKLIKLIRQGVKDGRISIYPPLPAEKEESKSDSPE